MAVNPHRGDTEIEVGEKKFILCYDLNACAMVMEKFKIQNLSDLAREGIGIQAVDLKGFIFLLWAGLQRNHPELTERDVGSLEWDLTDVSKVLPEAFRRGLIRDTNSVEQDDSDKGGEEQEDPLLPGAGSGSK